ncbi:hypothetical protein E2C01_080467 [Portunus trituberculatus]|uniref:Uncharacterized protein n=1 Tax=Portunus trituberculatus TaxID=210409 RepID=A0A5B7ITJ7_PORTR|nr:hypothetical protein [Portunus trituberculatus]
MALTIASATQMERQLWILLMPMPAQYSQESIRRRSCWRLRVPAARTAC